MTIGDRLEQYTLQHPQEVLIVKAEVAGESDEIAIFRGFSSSLMRPTAFDIDIPVLPADANILSIDRLQGPYDPANPQYLQQDLSWEDFLKHLTELGL
ncbi:hypothetical protein [Acaryochloris sp. CCMEE 5410]|uniref:DUF7734 family protein n=1 Tax=Acaryochloris sp. CCMEE 5410 TaxID=310037 RepID=UPI00024838E9|nr:hypothetical protein [Acaryochloris sp. CCMEE 5410]KAI9133481.1 hypothetical protein ON05_009290 [Acaryochloris sp. CCMEE 5410]